MLNKWKKSIALLVVVFAVSALLNGLLKPRVYTASVCFLFPSEQASSSALGSLGGILGLGGTYTSKRTIIALVKSKRMTEDIAERFFPDAYKGGAKKRDAVMRMVRNMITIDEMAEVITGFIEVKSNSPQLSADIANFCAANLDVINEKVKVTSEKPMIKVIDPAFPPVYPDSRNIKRNIMAAVIFAVFLGAFFAFNVEYFNKFRPLKA